MLNKATSAVDQVIYHGLVYTHETLYHDKDVFSVFHS